MLDIQAKTNVAVDHPYFEVSSDIFDDIGVNQVEEEARESLAEAILEIGGGVFYNGILVKNLLSDKR